ncbi:HAD hydrolase-like protein [Streptomyces sp. NPDC048341]|uniref:HAD hydrolase-like protein n=1 Tax=unclassified Streptomyces TaxID=2593676 RepID=UPI003429BB8E
MSWSYSRISACHCAPSSTLASFWLSSRIRAGWQGAVRHGSFGRNAPPTPRSPRPPQGPARRHLRLPHHPDGTLPRYRRICSCRKPAPGMLHQAAHDLGLDLSASWMVGDSSCDIDAGHRAGTCTALVGCQPLPDVTAVVHRATTSEALSQVLRCFLGGS